MPIGAFTAGRCLAVDDDLLSGSSLISVSSLSTSNFLPTGIFVNSSSDTDEEESGVATVIGTLVGDNSEHAWIINTKTPVGIGFKSINPTGTTARGIKLLTEM